MKGFIIFVLKVIALLALFALVGALPIVGIPAIIVFFWINWDKKKIVTVCHKARTKLKDSKGNVLYEDDIVYYDGFHKLTVPLCAKPWNEGYYVREYLTHEGMCSRVSDTNIDEHNVHMLTKVKDVINFPEKYWNKVKKLDIDKL